MPTRRIQDWHVIGVIDVPAPGRYEVLFSNFSGTAIRPIIDEGETPGGVETSVVAIEVGGTQILHTCSPCACCSACACREGGELYAGCWTYRAWAQKAEPGLQHYQAACAKPEGWFVVFPVKSAC